jgi:hypothetical protein
MKAGSIVTALAALAVFSATVASAGSAAPRRTSVSIVTAPGTTSAVRHRLRERGFRVDRRTGRRLQVVVRGPSQRRAIARVPGVAAVVVPQSAYGDSVTGQGVDRTGASSLADVGDGGAGLRIAVLDLGFGNDVPALQARGELPPPARVVLQSFDPAGGIAGSNAYGNPTDHGELVGQTIYDYAPRARYLFVSYHTPDDFVAAVDWMISQHVDVVVHSNNFLEGPFDGTSQLARAVDRAAAAGILWFNSGGNYGEKHWSGPWSDPNGDGFLDWPVPWTVTHDVNEALTFHLSWTNPSGATPSDIDIFLERQRTDGGWDVVATSADRQSAGAAPAERIAGLRPQQPGTYRLRAQLVSGPRPPGDLTLFAREDDIVSWSGSTAHSTPTPADAAGSISVGAIDWRSNSLVRYSSRGPTADGRLKPDISAPTGTRLATPAGDLREVGGTSIAAPNAAGAAALELASMRAAGLSPGVAEMRSILDADALDLGDPGPDNTFGAGRLRVDVDPPTVLATAAVPPRPVRGALRLAVAAADASPLATWALDVDGVRQRIGRLAREHVETWIATRQLADGPHVASIDVGDIVGNIRSRSWRFVVDNTAPVLDLQAVDVRRPVAAPGRPPVAAARRKRTVRLVVAASDGISPRVRIETSLTAIDGRAAGTRELTLQDPSPRLFVLARAPKGRYVVRVVATDTAGNATTVTRGLRVR